MNNLLNNVLTTNISIEDNDLIDIYALKLQETKDEKIFNQLYITISRFLDRIYKSSYEYKLGNIDKDDIIQDTLINCLLLKIDAWDLSKSSFITWVLSSFNHKIINYENLSRNRTTDSLSVLYEINDSLEPDYDALDTEEVEEVDESLEEGLHAEELQTKLNRVLERLPYPQREAWKMRYLHNCSYKTITKKLDIPTVNARQLVARTKQALLVEAGKYRRY